MLIEDKNATEIFNHIKETMVECEISKDKLNNIIKKIRYYRAHFLKDKYLLEDFSIRGNTESYAVDESKFVNLNNRLLWVIGIIHTSTKKIRLEVTFERDVEKLKKL